MEKEGLKSGGGYAGSFFHLFDWTAKSRKKLFTSKSDLPGTSESCLSEIFNIKYLSHRADHNRLYMIFSFRTICAYIFYFFAEHSKQGKKSDGNLPMTRFHLVGVWLLRVLFFMILILEHYNLISDSLLILIIFPDK